MTQPVPGPKSLPFVGNMLDLIDDEAPLRALEHLAEVYGPIYKLTRQGNRVLVVSSVEMMEELIDETRFVKAPPAALANDKSSKPYGLFTARNEDPDWAQAHRILMPAFGPLAIEGQFEQMQDVANQLLLKWARQGPEKAISVTDDFTRLTLDTIALCAMDFRFNSFYQDKMHPFVDAMVGFLSESGKRIARPAVVTSLMKGKERKLRADSEYMDQVSRDLVRHRRENPTDKEDLLNAMIKGKDPQTGEGMRDELIMTNMITFLIAGHETTSGLLSFAMLNLLKNESAYRAAQQEVDTLIGRGPVRVEHLKNLEYLNAVLRETLRLTPTAPAMSKQVSPKFQGQATLGKGKYVIDPKDKVIALLGSIQRDPKVYGEDANEFRPERMYGENFKKIPNAAWKPFGNGVRACIGRAFAWQEAVMVLAMLLQNFDFQLDDPGYTLRIKQTLTIKPLNLKMRATLRHKMNATDLERHLHVASTPSTGLATSTSDRSISSGGKIAASANGLASKRPMAILFGSNTGTCRTFAERLALNASAHGFEAVVKDMDQVTGQLPKSQPVIIITASYEGQPPDNAARFVGWLKNLDKKALENVQYAVFGCGHSDWNTTFQRIPTLVDTTMVECGASQIVSRGRTDASKGNMLGDFEDWVEQVLWPSLDKQSPGGPLQDPCKPMFDIEVSPPVNTASLREDVETATVVDARILTGPGEPPKHHLEIKLPEHMTYECGDYLAILPMNSDKVVQRIMTRFNIEQDSTMVVRGQKLGALPLDTPLLVKDVLKSCVELSDPASKKTLRTCIQYTTDYDTISTLESYLSNPSTFDTEILSKHTSLLSLLETHPSISLPFSEFLASLTPTRLRHYSISSSPLASPNHCTITYAIISGPSLSGPGSFTGVTGSYLSSLKPGDDIQLSIRPSSKALFKLPLSMETPLLMFCSGTGLAPFRGFIQQRAIQASANPGRPLAPALLFVGCRSATKDRLYAAEFDAWCAQGVVDVRYSFSREKENSSGSGYVQERLVKDEKDIMELWERGARVYVCGSGGFVKEVGHAAREIVRVRKMVKGVKLSEEALAEYFQGVLADRCATDVFG